MKDAPPPPSRYPRLDRGDLVPPTQAATGLPADPGRAAARTACSSPFYDYDFGPGFRNADVSGVVSLQPPVVRQTLPTLVPRVDADGNELAGVRSVLLEAPLGTYTGWNPMARGFFKGQIQPLGGGYIPFARRRRSGCAAGDPRLVARGALRQPRRLRRAREAPRPAARGERFLLQDDADRLVAQAEKSSVLR